MLFKAKLSSLKWFKELFVYTYIRFLFNLLTIMKGESRRMDFIYEENSIFFFRYEYEYISVWKFFNLPNSPKWLKSFLYFSFSFIFISTDKSIKDEWDIRCMCMNMYLVCLQTLTSSFFQIKFISIVSCLYIYAAISSAIWLF